MKWMLLVGLPVASLCAAPHPAGYVPPAFETRNIGDDQDISGTVKPGTKPQAKIHRITYVAVSELRQWRNLEGRAMRASLLAFDRLPGESDDGLRTLVRDGKVRFLLEGRKLATEYPLTELSRADQAFVRQLIEARVEARQAEAREADHAKPVVPPNGSE
jgi:hypothetical protein